MLYTGWQCANCRYLSHIRGIVSGHTEAAKLACRLSVMSCTWFYFGKFEKLFLRTEERRLPGGVVKVLFRFMKRYSNLLLIPKIIIHGYLPPEDQNRLQQQLHQFLISIHHHDPYTHSTISLSWHKIQKWMEATLFYTELPIYYGTLWNTTVVPSVAVEISCTSTRAYAWCAVIVQPDTSTFWHQSLQIVRTYSS